MTMSRLSGVDCGQKLRLGILIEKSARDTLWTRNFVPNSGQTFSQLSFKSCAMAAH